MRDGRKTIFWTFIVNGKKVFLALLITFQMEVQMEGQVGYRVAFVLGDGGIIKMKGLIFVFFFCV